MKSIFVSSTFRDMQAERDELALKVFPKLNKYANAFLESINFVDLRWGINTTDLDSDTGSKKVLSVCLNEIDNTRPYMIVLIGERYGWIPPIDMIKTAADNKNYTLFDYQKSVTELEIEYGALAKSGDLSRCLFYFRDFIPENVIPKDKEIIYKESDLAIKEKLENLKKKIAASGASIKSYTCTWDNNANQLIVSEEFAQMVFSDVQNLLKKELEENKLTSWQEREEVFNSVVAKQQANQFIEYNENLKTFSSAVHTKHNSLVFLQGKNGSGKSVLMSKLYTELSSDNETYYIDCSNSMSNSVLNILNQLIYKLRALTNIERISYYFDVEEKLQSPDNNINDLASILQQYTDLYQQQCEKKLYIFCDEYDVIMQKNISIAFSWLPNTLKDKITFIISFSNTFILPDFYPLKENSLLLKLNDITIKEAPVIINNKLKSLRKELPEQLILNISKLEGSTTPLYINMCIQRLLMMNKQDFESISIYGNDMNAINQYMQELLHSLPNSTDKLAFSIIEEASKRVNAGLCMLICKLLAKSKFGLRQSDLQAIISRLNLPFDAVDTSVFFNYLPDFFITRHDGRIDFSNKVIREGVKLVYNCDEYAQCIYSHILTLDTEDILTYSDFVWLCYELNQFESLNTYISDIYSLENEIALTLATKALKEITKKDNSWIKDFFGKVIVLDNALYTIEFLNSYFFESFEFSEIEYKKVLDIFGDFLNILNEKQSKIPPYYFNIYVFYINDILGNANLILAKHDISLNYYLDNLLLIQNLSLSKDNNTQNYQEEYYLHTKIACIYSTLYANNDLAFAHYEKASEINDILKDVLPVGDYFDNSFELKNEITRCLLSLYYHEEAKELCETNLQLTQAYVKLNSNVGSYYKLFINYLQLGDVYQAKHNFEKANEYYKKSLDIIKDLVYKTSFSYFSAQASRLYGKMAKNFSSMQKPELALKYHKMDCENSEFLNFKYLSWINSRKLIYSYNNIAIYYTSNKEYKNALNYAEKAMDMIKTLPENINKHIDLARIFLTVGDIYIKTNEYQKAITYYTNSLDTLAKIQDSDNLNIERLITMSNVYNQMGVANIKIEKFDTAIDFLTKGIDVCEILIKKLNIYSIQNNMASISGHLGDCYSEMQDDILAMIWYSKSNELYKNIYANNPTLMDSENYSYSCFQLAMAYQKSSNSIMAISCFKKHLTILKDVLTSPFLSEKKKGVYSKAFDSNAIKMLELYNKKEVRENSKSVSEEVSLFIDEETFNDFIVYLEAYDYNSKANELEEKKSYGYALENYYKANSSFKLLTDKKSKVDCKNFLFSTNAKIGELLYLDKQIDTSLEFFKDSIKIYKSRIINETPVNSMQIFYAKVLDKTAVIYKEKVQIEKAIEYLKESFETKSSLPKTQRTLNETSYTLVTHGDILIEMQQYDDALKLFLKNLDVQKEMCDKIESQANLKTLSIANERVAEVYNQQSKIDESLKFWYNSLEIQIKSANIFNDNSNASLAITYSNIANLHKKTGDFKSAIDSAKKSLEFRQEIYETDKTLNNLYRVAITMGVLSNIYIDIEEYDKALSYLYISKDNFQTIYDNDKLDYDYRSLGICISSIAKVFIEKEDYVEAQKHFTEVLKISGYLYKNNDVSLFKSDYRNNLNRAGLIYTKLKQFDEAEKILSESLALSKDIYQKTKEPIQKINIANGYTNLAIMYAEKNEYDKAFNLFSKSKELLEEILMSSSIISAKEELYETLMKTAILFKNINDYDSAIKTYNESINIYEKLIENNKSFILQKKLAENYSQLADVYTLLNDPKNSLLNYEKAAIILEKITEKVDLAVYYKSLIKIYKACVKLTANTDVNLSDSYALKLKSTEKSLKQ